MQARVLDRPFDYAVAAPLARGAIVAIPLGPRRVRGVVVGPGSGEHPGRLRLAEPTGAVVPDDLVTLALDLAERYATSPARALELVLPPEAPARPALWAVPGTGPPPRSARQVAVLDALADGPLPLAALREASGASADTIRRLVRRGLLTLEERAAAGGPADVRPDLTDHQEVAVARVLAAVDARDPGAILLFGVTGSGKTEVFLRGVERALAAGRSAIVLVPEIALAPQTAGRVAARFGPIVAVVHSGLTAGERAAEYARIARGEARVVVGARSAILAPVRDLGLIVIDEEHESAYKQDSDPRYDARAVAMVRARHHGAPVVLSSATPRPETWHLVPRVELPARVAGSLPPVEVVDLTRDGSYPVSRPLHDALGGIADDGGRAILLLNRRGEAPALHCRECGITFRCPDCDVAMTLHRAPPGLRCHHCGRDAPVPATCPACNAVDIARIGAGTERLERVIADRYPALEVMRLDADVTARRGALEETLDRFGSTERAVLVGTQLVAKGHHFPGVRLAAAVDADVGLAQPDFRAEERTFALLVQLAGRAGREGTGGRVLIQSWSPESRVVRLAARHAVAAFLDGELTRRELLGYPPYRRIVRVQVTADSMAVANTVLHRLADAARPALGGDALLGPAPLGRLRGRERAHLIVKTGRARRAAAVLGGLAARDAAAMRRAGATIVVDVDPQSMVG